MGDIFDLLGISSGSIVPAALFRAFCGTGIELLALLLVAFRGGGTPTDPSSAIVGQGKVGYMII